MTKMTKMTTKTSTYYVDRSRVIQYQECGRKRFLEYHESGTGIRGIKKPLPLAVGGAVHAGIEVLLRAHIGQPSVVDDLPGLEEQAVAGALAEFGKYSKSGLELDLTESSQMKPSDTLGLDLAKSLGLPPDHPDVQKLVQAQGDGMEKFDRYLVEEQSALVEALVRAYTRRRLRKLLEQFEILEVEREGTWQLYFSDDDQPAGEYEIVFMSRPDALLRDRESNQLVILSLKTTSSWDIRKARDAEHDMQGLSEGVEVEQRLAVWWRQISSHVPFTVPGGMPPKQAEQEGLIPSLAIVNYLKDLSSPPRIYAIRYEYFLKGDRKNDETISQETGVQSRVQNSHLVRPYCNPGMTVGDAQWAWSYKFKKEDGSGSNLYYKNWKTRPIWRAMSIKTWIDQLEAATETYSAYDPTVGMEPRLLGYQCLGGQAVGFTERHPLDAVFIEPITVFRNDDDLRDWIDQTACQEERVVDGLVQIREASDPSHRRHLLNKYFPMVRTSCEYPSSCTFVGVCYANNEDTKMNPLGTGKFERRIPNHPQEAEIGTSQVSETSKTTEAREG